MFFCLSVHVFDAARFLFPTRRPVILLADEPTGNLDPLLSREIVQLFGQFNQVGVTVMIASHDVALVRASKRRAVILREGELWTGEFDGQPVNES